MVKRKEKTSLKRKVDQFWAGLEDDLKLVGQIGVEEIVRTTLAGIGENDQPFKQYSKSYAEQIAAVGGKASGVVDLRGIFYHGAKGSPKVKAQEQRILRALKTGKATLQGKGAGRRGIVTITLGGKTFNVRTRLTRPRLGLLDPASEMSIDLITVKVTKDHKIKFTYKPRRADEAYMIDPHQTQRPWFSLNKTGVREALVFALKQVFKLRVAAFNGGNNP
jgi:hypothetical protein